MIKWIKVLSFIVFVFSVLIILAVMAVDQLYLNRYTDNRTYQGTIDLERYSGQWHQILETKTEIPLIMEFIFSFVEDVDKSCSNTIVNYTLRNKDIFLKNECYVDGLENRRVEITGTASPINPENTKFKVRFSPWYMKFAAFDYWIVNIDPSYSIAVLASPASKGITLLSRTKNPDGELYKRALAIASSMGYDLSRSIKTPREASFD
jgi:apolipoprotein D and lipocalin family protein